MKVRNITNNTLYAEDIDLHIPFEDKKVIELTPDQLKRSKALRAMIIGLMLEVVGYDDAEQVEAATMFLRNKRISELSKKPEENPEKEIEKEIPRPVITSPLLQTVNEEIEVKVHGLFYDDSGYAKVNRNFTLKLHEAGFKVKISPKNSRNQLSEEELKPIAQLEKTKLSRNHIQIDSIVPSFSELSTGKYKVLYTTSESYTLPKQFVDCCQLYEEIWLTSYWSASIVKQYIDKPVYVVPAGVDETHYKEDGPSFNLKPTAKNFVFLSVFSWSYRKGYDVLLKAYFDEFSANDDVTLLIMSKYQGNISRHHKNKIKEDIEQIMKQFPNKDLPHVARHNQLVAEKDMPKMYRSANCFILTSRGEGSALPPVEASLCGLPIIMTNVSGQQMYLRPDNAYLIEPDELVEIQPNQIHIHFWNGQKFPALKSTEVHAQTRKAMRSVYENYTEAKTRNKKLQELILNNFTWTHTANAATTRLKAIHETMKGNVK